MHDDPRACAFESFIDRHAADFRRIAGASRGEWKAEDVRNEAWLLAFDLGESRGHPLDLDDLEDADLLVRYLHNHCVKYTERVVRHAVRLDHAASGDDERGDHWLNDHLAANGGMHPLSLLEAMESRSSEQRHPDAYHSPAAGWVWLVSRFDNRMAAVASFLLISASWCRDRYRKARHDADTQWPLPHGLSLGDDDTAIRPWRKFKLPEREPGVPGQLSLDYWNMPTQPASGQLWLL